MALGLPGSPRPRRLLVTPFVGALIAAVLLAGCGSSSPSGQPGASGNPSASASPGPIDSSSPASSSPPSESAAPSPAPSGAPISTAPTAAMFWSRVTSSIAAATRLRVVVTRPDPVELRYEPKASGAATHGNLQTACIDGVWYTIVKVRATPVKGKWACGSAALADSFRAVGQPLEAWNSTLPMNTRVKEAVTIVANGRWQWRYTARSAQLGIVITTVLMDPTSGRVISGQRTDSLGLTAYTFSYTSIFAPIELP